MTLSPSTEPSQADINRAANVLFNLLTWQGGFDNDKAVRSLREAKLDAAIDRGTAGRPRVHQAVLRAFRALAGRAAVWDRAGEVWRERRKGDQP